MANGLPIACFPACLAAFAMVPLAASAVATADTDFFEKRIRPLLAEHCVGCHGSEKQKGNLRLDSRSGWESGGDSGPAILPHNLDESLVWRAVSYTDRDLKMPPKKKLSAAQIEDLQQWIASGAPDPRDAPPEEGHKATGRLKADAHFWSFQQPQPQRLPEVKATDWPANDIDRFILARLESNKLTPAEDAAPATLLRRLYFDLTGLPPSPELMAEWTPSADAKWTAAIERLVDRLLGSEAFAERWASHWLDITRFAESSGGGRSLPFKDAWRFRDYVIESIRDDVPLDRMITEHIAGDLLPTATAADRRRQLTATGFLVLGPTNYEEQDKQMLRMDIVDEQMDTLGKSFLGMTIGCARCHDHKFDPISTRDYYALAGIFRSTRTLENYTDNVAHWIDMPLPLDGQAEIDLQTHEKEVAAVRSQIASLKDQLRDAGGADLRKKKTIAVSDLPGIVIDDAEAMKVGEWKVSKIYGPFIGASYVHDLNAGKGDKTISFTPRIPKTGRYEVRVAFNAGPGRAEKIAASILHADGEELVHFKEKTEELKGLQFASLGTFRFEANGQGFVLITNGGAEGFVTVDAVQFLPVDEGEIATASKASPASRREAELKAQLTALEKELRRVQAGFTPRPEAMTVAEDEAPEDARVHIRGSIRNLGAPVPRGFIQAISKGPAPAIAADESGRLQLAQWMTSADNPLTARVLVNRVWHWLFGAGIVRTTENFGITGETPSHPELLDHLALRFMEQGWNLKKLVRELVLSHTYRMSSEPLDAPGASLDPDNRLLWRMNRKRLDAECLRDAILATAATLELKVGGPNIGDATAVDSNDTKAQNLEYGYAFNDTRRSLYTPAFRNVRHPLFEVFDFADINQPIAQRTTSTVATQALFLMNHPMMIDQARRAANRLLGDESLKTDTDRIQHAYAIALNRPATTRERAAGADFVEASISGNATTDERRDAWARLVQTLWSTPDFRFLK